MSILFTRHGFIRLRVMAQDEAAMVATAQDDGQNIGQEDDGPEDDVAKRSLAPEGRGAGRRRRGACIVYRERRCQAGGDKPGARGEEVRRQGEDKGWALNHHASLAAQPCAALVYSARRVVVKSPGEESPCMHAPVKKWSPNVVMICRRVSP
jgi:hypothetical protein